METKVFHIANIRCVHCIHTIAMELEQLNGVKKVEGDVNTKIITVNFEAPATEKKIKDLLATIDYPTD